MSGNTSATGGYLQPISTQPLDADGIANLLQAMVVGLTGLSSMLVRPRWQPQPPTQPSVATDWCAIGVEKYTAFDFPYVVHDDTVPNGVDDLYRLERIDVLATFYGPNSSTYSAYVRDGVYIQQNYQFLAAFGLKLRGAEDIEYMPELINAQYVSRSDLPMSFMRYVERTYPVLDLLGAVVQVTADNGDGCIDTISEQE